MALRLVSAPADRVISLDEAKGHLGVLHSDDDTLIEGFVDAATALLDGSPGELNRALLRQVWEYALDGFPLNPEGTRRDGVIYLPLAPVISVDEITYVDPSGQTRALALTDWSAQLGERPLVWVKALGSWPAALARPGSVTVKFTAGYADVKAVPAPIKVAIKMLVGELYANRGDEGMSSLPTPVDRLISPFRHWPG